jgi:hypothetical protein
LSPLSAVLAVAARLPREMPFPAPVPGSVVGCAYAGSASSCAAAISCLCCGGSPPKSNVVCACTRVTDIAVGGLRLDFHRLQCVRLASWSALLAMVALALVSPPSAVLAVAARLPRAMLSPVPVTISLVGCACAGCACTRCAAISCPCCGGSHSKGNSVSSSRAGLFCRLCLRWQRFFLRRRHQLPLLWRLTSQE